MPLYSRRSFLKTSAAAGVGAALSARSWGQVPGANSAIRLAVIGCDFPHGRGQDPVKGFGQIKGVRVAAICDIDTANLESTSAALQKKGRPVQTHVDFRELLARSDIDAVSIATPNHWHSLIAILALQAGKDVYVEKPISHNVWEGRQVVNAAAKSSRVIQAGTQCRSGGIADGVAWVRAGNFGKILVSRGLCYKKRATIGLTEGPQPVPKTVNYDLWLGPAPMTALRRQRLHYDWHWIWATGNGDLGNQGIHQMDIARWFLGEPGLAPHTLSVGGRLGYVDDGETPNSQIVVHDYAAAPLVFEVRGLPAGSGASEMDKYPETNGASVGVIVHCEGGTVIVPSYTKALMYDRSGKLIKSFESSGSMPDVATSHMANFIDVVRSRKKSDLHGPIEEGHPSSALCHTGNISYRLGRMQATGELREKIKGNAAMNEAFGRMSEHLARNGVLLDKTPATLGMPLVMDPATERFPDNAEANALLTRNYRAPYVVPDLS